MRGPSSFPAGRVGRAAGFSLLKALSASISLEECNSLFNQVDEM